MKRIFIILFVFCCIASTVAAQNGLSQRSVNKLSRSLIGSASLSDACPSVVPILALWKVTAGGHITSGRRETGFSLICSPKQCPKSRLVSFFYSDGSLAGQVAYYGRWVGNGLGRYYGGTGKAPQHFVKIIRRNAKRSGRDGNLYINMGNHCASVSADSDRSGSPF